MMLAEALARRSDTTKRIEQLRARIFMNISHLEGDLPQEEPLEMLNEADTRAEELEDWIRRINRTNASTQLDDEMSLTDALARRDALRLRHSLWSGAADHAASDPSLQYRNSPDDLRLVASMPVPALRRVAEDLAREIRTLDLRIQSVNWRTELID